MCNDMMNFMKNKPFLSLLYQVFNPQAKKQAFEPPDLSCLKAALVSTNSGLVTNGNSYFLIAVNFIRISSNLASK